MSNTISDLLIRNLRDVFGENDPARRRAAIDEIWAEDGVFYDPKSGAHRGRDEIDRVAGAIKATHPDFRYQPIAEPQELGDAGMVPWISGLPGEVPAYSGTDFLIARDGRIAALYLSFDKRPELDSTGRGPSYSGGCAAPWRGCRDSRKPGPGALLFLRRRQSQRSGSLKFVRVTIRVFRRPRNCAYQQRASVQESRRRPSLRQRSLGSPYRMRLPTSRMGD